MDDELTDAVREEMGSKFVQTPEVRGESLALVLARVDTGSAPPDTTTTEAGEKTEEFEYTADGETMKGTRRVLTLDLGGGVTMELVRIPHGKFMMGGGLYPTPGETPQHEVTITKDFYLGKYLVTQEQYKALIGENPSWFAASGYGKDKVAGLDTGRFPVEMVSWDDALAFCQKLSERASRKVGLPTEAQWEYACRAGTELTEFPCGDELTAADANINNKLGQHLCRGVVPAEPVRAVRHDRERLRVVFGLLRCRILQKIALKKTLKNSARKPARYRVLRGGSWGHASTYCCAARRSVGTRGTSADGSDHFGFRVRVLLN